MKLHRTIIETYLYEKSETKKRRRSQRFQSRMSIIHISDKATCFGNEIKLKEVVHKINFTAAKKNLLHFDEAEMFQ